MIEDTEKWYVKHHELMKKTIIYALPKRIYILYIVYKKVLVD